MIRMVPPFSTTNSRSSSGGEVRSRGKASPLAIRSRPGAPEPGGGGGAGGAVAVTVIAMAPATSSTVAPIAASPARSPVTIPNGETAATAGSALVHSTARSSTTFPAASSATASSCRLSPTAIVVAGASTVTSAMAGGSVPWRSSPPSQAGKRHASASRTGRRNAAAGFVEVAMPHRYHDPVPATVTQIPVWADR
jgi:hypothetical protein